MRSRPHAEIRVPSRVHPGDRAVVEVSLESASRTPIEGIWLDLYSEAITPGTNQGPHVTRRWQERAQLSGPTELEEKSYAYRASFTLPADTPPSFTGSTVEIRYRLELRVAIPWWPDLEQVYDLKVSPRPTPRPARAPAASTSLRRNEPFIELSLDDAAWSPGDEVTGSFAYGNVDRTDVRGVSLALVGYEQDRVSGGALRETLRCKADLPYHETLDGHENFIRFVIPAEIPVSFTCAEASLGWAFEVRVDLVRGPDVVHAAPVAIAIFDRPATPGPMRRLVGNGRWAAVWAEVGRRHGLALGDVGLALTGSIDGCQVAVRTTVREGQGQLTAEIRWDPWDLDLSVGPRGLLDLAGSPVEDELFNKRFRIRGREPAQLAAALGTSLRASLAAFDDAVLDDAHAAVHAAAPGHDQPWIGEFVAKVAALAAAAREAAERIPPPADLVPALAAWRAFAAASGGKLTVGSMRVRDAFVEGGRFDVESVLEKGGTVRAARLRLTVDPPLPAGVELAATAAAKRIEQSLARDGRALAVETERIELTIPGPLLDPAAERETMSALLAFAAALRGDRGIGPYR